MNDSTGAAAPTLCPSGALENILAFLREHALLLLQAAQERGLVEVGKSKNRAQPHTICRKDKPSESGKI